MELYSKNGNSTTKKGNYIPKIGIHLVHPDLGTCPRLTVNRELIQSSILALYWASYGGHIEVAEVFLQSPFVNVNAVNKLGDTPLIAACYKGHANVCQAQL